jgi:hypothetical protein
VVVEVVEGLVAVVEDGQFGVGGVVGEGFLDEELVAGVVFDDQDSQPP